MQTRLHEFKERVNWKYNHNQLEERLMMKSFLRKEQKYFVRDCLHFIKANQCEPDLQAMLLSWVADRRRRYGIPFNDEEIAKLNEYVKDTFHNLSLRLVK